MEKKRINIKSILTGIGVILLYFISSSIYIDVLNLFGVDYNKLSITVKSIYLGFYELILTLIIVYIYKKDFIPNLKDFIKNNTKYFKEYIKYWFMMLGLMMIVNILITNFTTSLTSNNQQAIMENLKIAPIYTFVVTVFIAPVLEELVFRLSFRKIFYKNDILFIIISGLVFGSLHVLGSFNAPIDLLFIIPYSIPGFIFAYIYCNSKNICVSMSIHFIHNGIMLLLSYILFMLT